MWRVLVERSEQPQGTAPPYFHPVMQLLSNRRAVFYKESVTLNVWNKPIAASSVFCIRMMAIYCKSVHIMLQELMKKTTIRYLFKMQCSAVPNSIFHSNSMDKQSSSEMKLSAMQHCELLLWCLVRDIGPQSRDRTEMSTRWYLLFHKIRAHLY